MRPEAAIVTPSYCNDFEYARDLCQSIDRHMKADFEHLVIVPRRDVKLFQPLATKNRRILAMEDLMKVHGFRRLPIPTNVSIPGLVQRKIKERWWVPKVGIVNGWILQQIVKLSTPQLTQAELLILVDSDVEMFRDFDPDTLWQHGDLNLHQDRDGAGKVDQQLWSRVARELLGLPAHSEPEEFNYIGNLIVWRRSNVLKLQERLEMIHSEEWWRVLAKRDTFSEYMLYGLFCRDVLKEESGSIFSDLALYNSIWTDEQGVSADLLFKSLRPSHVALHIQSTIPLAMVERREIIDEVSRRAATLAADVVMAGAEQGERYGD